MKIKPNLKKFVSAAGRYNVIPVSTEIGEDVVTPIQLYSAIKNKKGSFLLESVEGEEKVSRFSFVGFNPLWIFKSQGPKVKITSLIKNKNIEFNTSKGPLVELRKFIEKFNVCPSLPFRFSGGFVGYVGYDNVRFFEPVLQKGRKINQAQSQFVFCKYLFVFDHKEKKVNVISFVVISEQLKNKELRKRYEDEKEELVDLIKWMGLKNRIFPLDFTKKKLKYRSNITKKSFMDKVKKIKKYIKKGDIIQAVLSQRLTVSYKKDPFRIYRYLRVLNPSPYMYFLDLGEKQIVGASPEMLLRCEGKEIFTRPIAGTRKRGRDEKEDNNLSFELLNDPKERAEHIMLVDLGRNDLGRVSEKGKVELPLFMNIGKFSHVMHLVSEVKGRLFPGKDGLAALQACFPAGTVSGAPKIRAMQIIDELEPSSREVYAGALGYVSFSGNLDTAIIIRTIVVENERAYVQAGAGIVLDSQPEKEYFETMNKANALLNALEYSV